MPRKLPLLIKRGVLNIVSFFSVWIVRECLNYSPILIADNTRTTQMIGVEVVGGSCAATAFNRSNEGTGWREDVGGDGRALDVVVAVWVQRRIAIYRLANPLRGVVVGVRGGCSAVPCLEKPIPVIPGVVCRTNAGDVTVVVVGVGDAIDLCYGVGIRVPGFCIRVGTLVALVGYVPDRIVFIRASEWCG